MSPFAQLFDDLVQIEATRPSGTVRGGFAACVMPIADADVLEPDAIQSDLARFSVLIAIEGPEGWNAAALGTRPQIGDIVILKSGLKSAVVKVSPVVDDWYELETREVRNVPAR